MLQDSPAFSGFSIADSVATKKFYGDTLGLDIRDVPGMEDMGMLTLHTAGNNPILLYTKADHKPATHTVLTFPVPDIDAAVAELKKEGVEFDIVDGMQQDEQGIMRGKSMQMGPDIAWFKDPSGNSLAVCED